MKMSLDKKWGHIHVRGGALVRVTHEHQVSVVGYDQRYDDDDRDGAQRRQFEPGQKWTTAVVGDLAVEVWNVKMGTLIGHAYLSGAAINVMRYTPARPEWFEPARLVNASEQLWSTTDENDAFKVVMSMKYAHADVVVAVIEHPNADLVAQFVSAAATMEPVVALPDHEQQVADVVVLITGKNKMKKKAYVVHHQPKVRAGAYGLGPFEAQLLAHAQAVPLVRLAMPPMVESPKPEAAS